MNYRSYLTDDILPFWIKYGIDREDGGVLTSLDRYGNVKDTEKNIWFIGRALWCFAMAYRLIEAKKEYLDSCECIYSFFDKCVLSENRLPFSAKKNGECIVYRNAYYSEGFAAIGCAQYYRICRREDVKKRAEVFFDTAYSRYTDPHKKIMSGEERAPFVSFGLEMFMLNVAQFVRNAGIRVEECDTLAKQTVYNMKHNGHITDDLKTVREYIPITDKPLLPPRDLYSCPGHVYEAAWFVMCEGEIKNDSELRSFGLKLLDYAMPDGFEEKEPLIITGINDPQYNNYIWWPQCEAVIAYYLGYNISGNEKYLKIARQIEDYAFSHFADYENGEWYAQVSKSGDVLNYDKGTIIKGPFHLPRMLFALVSLDENKSILRYMQ